ncbi:MAG: hypothetical protein AAB466_12820 [Verrucomicrobiota bacterium]
MKTTYRSILRHTFISVFLLAMSLAGPLQARILDNFDDNTKTAWSDFTFNAALGPSRETDGMLRFELPPVGQSIFIASQKTSEEFELKEGRTIEFRVDVAQGGDKDSFAVLAFIPTSGSPGTLGGYGLAKSTTDILITKGINKYFVADDGPEADLKNENITLVLTLAAKDGNVIITAKALDKENSNAVMWEKTVIDTPAADVLVSGTDSPAAPYLTTGYFTLYLYEDYSASAPETPYRIVYDNAEVYVTDTTMLDDFNDNTKTAWSDFTFSAALGPSRETEGQLRFELPPVGQSIFIASQKTSRVFDLSEGERVQFSVDVAQGGEKDSFAVLAFIPTTGSPGTLAGYGFAKSTTDVLITKGISKYFVADDGPEADLKNDNITLVLTLTVKEGSVTITAKVLDKENNNAVMWEKTVIDTPAADVLVSGTDSPAAPYLTSGYFTLYLYEDYSASAPENPYRIYYDNAIVSAPPVAANVAPIISETQPAEHANFLPASTQISFKVHDDKALSDDKISVTLNGAKITKANGLTVSGSGGTKTATLGGLAANVNYTATLGAEDSDGVATSKTLYFDTFAENSYVIEIEDYNFSIDGVSGKFIDNPVLISEGSGPQADAYSLQTAVQNVDFNDTRTTPRPQDTLYRPFDPIRMQHTLDSVRAKYTAAGGADAFVFDYDVGDIEAGEWLDYTRTFPPGSYEVYLREALVNMASGESVLEEVTGDITQPSQTTKVLGSFLGGRTGFQHRNFALTDATGQNKVILRLSGATTLRLRQVTADAPDGARYQNYLLFNPVADAGLQRATIGSISPTAGAEIESLAPALAVTIQNRDTSVRTNTIVLTFNGNPVSPRIVGDANGATVTYDISPLPPSNSTNTARIVFSDNLNVSQTNEWSFVLTYKAVDPLKRQPGSGADPGFNVRVVQAPLGSGLANSLQRAEDQLAPNSTIAKFVDTNTVATVINFNKIEGNAGAFENDNLVPGIDANENGTDDFAVEILAYLDLPAGVHRFGFITDDGYKVQTGSKLGDVSSPVLAFHNGGPANETVDFLVLESGLYPFRMVWYERGGAGYAEWFSVDRGTGTRTLINDPSSASAIKAFRNAIAPAAIKVESSAALKGTFAEDTAAVVDTTARTITIPLKADAARFYRLNSDERTRITSSKIVGGNVVLEYEIVINL